MNARTPVIISSVVLFHVAALWALHTGLLQRVVEVVVPVMAISQAEPPPPPPKPPEPVKPPEPPKTPPPPKPVQPVFTPPPTPQTPTPATPEPPAVLAAPAAAPTAPAVQAAPPAPPPPAASPTPPSISSKPSEDAFERATPLPEYLSKDYLENLNRKFSRSMSGRMGEHGRVLLEVVVDKNGQVKSAVVLNPSPFPRLDKFALDIVATWKFRPAKRNGIPEDMAIKVPFSFEEQKN